MGFFLGFSSLLGLLGLVPYVVLIVYLIIWLRQKTQRDLVVLDLLAETGAVTAEIEDALRARRLRRGVRAKEPTA